MAITKTASGWLVDIRADGRESKRFRKTLPTKAEALTYEAWLKTKLAQSPEWQPVKKSGLRLSELVALWHTHHGVNLRAGKNTFSRLKLLCTALGNPLAIQLKPENFAAYRNKRLSEGISANNLNREHAYLRAVFNELERLGHWKGVNPLSKIRQIKISERELSFLSLAQIDTLLSSLKNDALLVTKICLSTGARWSEAEELRVSQVQNGLIQFTGTKSGKNRSVPVDDVLIAELDAHLEKRYGSEKAQAVRFFVGCCGAFRKGVEKAELVLPDGQMTHVLRHTFASHFVMNGGNILVLQKILGHASLTMTMRYAHLAPDHLLEAKAFNPLRSLTK
jgi:integrase